MNDTRLNAEQVAEIERLQGVASESGTWSRWETGALVVKAVPALLADRIASAGERELWLFDATARYDELARRFYADTGLMAPGKDVPAALGSTADPRERRERFDAWLHDKCNTARAALSGERRADA